MYQWYKNLSLNKIQRILQQAQAGLQDIQRGKSAAATWADQRGQLVRGFFAYTLSV